MVKFNAKIVVVSSTDLTKHIVKMMADEDISLNEDQILDHLEDTNGEMLNEVSNEVYFLTV